MIAVTSSRLSPEHALAYLRELQPGAVGAALLGRGGVLLAGEEGELARAGRELQRTGGERSLEGSLLALRAGEHAIAANLPDAGGALAEFDLRCVASATGVSFDR